MIFTLVGGLSIAILFTFAFTNVGRLQEPFRESGKRDNSELCGPMADGLKFCTDSGKISVNLGDSFSLNFSLSNFSQQEIWINRNHDTSYHFVVTTESGAILATKNEQKLRRGSTSDNELRGIISSSWISHRPEDTKLIKTVREKIVLSDIYDFGSPGTYWVEVFRTTRNPNGEGFVKLHLERIEIEVK